MKALNHPQSIINTLFRVDLPSCCVSSAGMHFGPVKLGGLLAFCLLAVAFAHGCLNLTGTSHLQVQATVLCSVMQPAAMNREEGKRHQWQFFSVPNPLHATAVHTLQCAAWYTQPEALLWS